MALLVSLLLKLLFLQLLYVVVLGRESQLGHLSTSIQIDAIYQFGDSMSDTGNNIREDPTAVCTSFPYGESYFKFATGRCSDGLIMADYYARAFGLQFLNPYLDRSANFSNGVVFSVGGATALDVAFLESKNLTVDATNTSFSVQLGWFRNHLRSICSSADECKNNLKTSIFFMEAFGGDDYNVALGDYTDLQSAYELVPYVIRAIMDGIKEMIDMGGVNVVVPGITPFGCLSAHLSGFNSTDPSMYDEIGCAIVLNEFCKFHNRKLRKATKQLQTTYPNVTLIFADYYYPIRRVLKNPASFGFEENNTLIACCGDANSPYNFNWSAICGTIGVSVCPNPKQRVVWDGLHYTQQTYKYISEWMLNHTIIPQLSHALSI